MIAEHTFNHLVAKAYRLALFLHPEPEAAKQLVERAVTLLPATYPQPKPKGSNKRPSRRAVFSEAQWLQHLILYLSERIERDKEQRRPPEQAELIKRYLKLLVQICLPNTTLHVAVGLSRLFFHYTTSDTNLLLERLDDGRIVEEASLNRIKGNIQRQLKQRFGDLLRETTGPNREKLFVSLTHPEPWFDLVTACLEQLTPWETGCDLDESDLHKSHRLIHLPCLASLCRELGLAEPFSQIRLPRGTGMHRDDMDDQDPQTEDMAPPEQARLYRHYSWVVQMRQKVQPLNLNIKTNDQPRGQWHLTSGLSRTLDLGQSDRILEVWAEQGEQGGGQLPLAVFHIGPDPGDMSLDLDQGGRLTLHVQETGDHRRAYLTFRPSILQRLALFRASPRRPLFAGAALSACLILGFLVGRSRHIDRNPGGETLLRSSGTSTVSGTDKRLDQYDLAVARALFERGEYLFGNQSERAEEALASLEIAYSLSGSDLKLTADILNRLIFISAGLGKRDKAAFYQEKLRELQRPPP